MNTAPAIAATEIEFLTGDDVFAALDAIDAGATVDEAFEQSRDASSALEADGSVADCKPVDREHARPGTMRTPISYTGRGQCCGESTRRVEIASEGDTVHVWGWMDGAAHERGHVVFTGSEWVAYRHEAHATSIRVELGRFSRGVDAIRATAKDMAGRP